MAFSPTGLLPELRDQLAFTADLGDVDDVLLVRKLEAAVDHINGLLGWKMETRIGTGAGQYPVLPPALAEAVLQLAAHWYAVRETASETQLREIPFGVAELVRDYREWTF